MDQSNFSEECASCGLDEDVLLLEEYGEVPFCESCLDRASPAEQPYDDLGGSE